MELLVVQLELHNCPSSMSSYQEEHLDELFSPKQAQPIKGQEKTIEICDVLFVVNLCKLYTIEFFIY